ncbi:MAG: nitrite/sulfite reductase [Candidatus Omnitrophica bacterium]|nr:nitrite/sulfite reductase [Candidatus Omnitrophota bacterium]
MKKPFEPNLGTKQEDFSKEELNKLNKSNVFDQYAQEMRNDQADISWEAEQIAKSTGIYMEFDRSVKGAEKHWMYMIRISNVGGGPVNRQQWQLFDELASKYTKNPQGHPSLRLTTRQAIQFHWVSKEGVLDIVKTLAENKMPSLNACGDNTRNVMSCPLSQFSDVFNANQWAHKAGSYFQLPIEPFIKIFAIDPEKMDKPAESFQYGPNLLNRKFKIAFSAAHRDPSSGKIVPDNCVELRTNDLGIAPVIEGDKINGFQIYVGGGQGERNGKPAMAALAQPLCIVSEDKLLQVLDAVVAVHQEWGDRQNRHWARLKYVIKKMGVDWYRDQVSARVGYPLEKPNNDYDYGDRELHFGWHQQPSNGLWAYGAFIENGRLIDNSPNGKLKTMVREIMDKYPVELMVTPNQDILFTNIPEDAKSDFEADLASYGHGKRNGKVYSTLRQLSGACVGRDTCRLTYTDSEQFEPELMDQLEELGWGDTHESIGITGCERQCFRPATKSIGLVGSGLNRYQFKLFGDETGKFQGKPLISGNGEEMYLRSIMREDVARVIDVLFKHHKDNAQANEGLGAFHRRIGADAIISHLKDHETTAALMDKPFNTDCILDT